MGDVLEGQGEENVEGESGESVAVDPRSRQRCAPFVLCHWPSTRRVRPARLAAATAVNVGDLPLTIAAVYKG